MLSWLARDRIRLSMINQKEKSKYWLSHTHRWNLRNKDRMGKSEVKLGLRIYIKVIYNLKNHQGKGLQRQRILGGADGVWGLCGMKKVEGESKRILHLPITRRWKSIPSWSATALWTTSHYPIKRQQKQNTLTQLSYKDPPILIIILSKWQKIKNYPQILFLLRKFFTINTKPKHHSGNMQC